MTSPNSYTVLLVEDDAQLRRVARRVLAGLGYTVLDAPNGRVALDVLRSHPDPVHLVLTDLAMPEMNGHELAVELRRERPATKVLFMSGYGDKTSGVEAVLGPGDRVVQKPFTTQELADAVRAAIEA